MFVCLEYVLKPRFCETLLVQVKDLRTPYEDSESIMFIG